LAECPARHEEQLLRSAGIHLLLDVEILGPGSVADLALEALLRVSDAA
jgi:hypothetical protein